MLHWHRHSVSAVRLLPRRQPAADVGGAHHCIAGHRVALAYLLSATPLGVTGIWLSVPIGWALADAIGIGYYLKKKQ